MTEGIEQGAPDDPLRRLALALMSSRAVDDPAAVLTAFENLRAVLPASTAVALNRRIRLIAEAAEQLGPSTSAEAIADLADGLGSGRQA